MFHFFSLFRLVGAATRHYIFISTRRTNRNRARSIHQAHRTPSNQRKLLARYGTEAADVAYTVTLPTSTHARHYGTILGSADSQSSRWSLTMIHVHVFSNERKGNATQKGKLQVHERPSLVL